MNLLFPIQGVATVAVAGAEKYFMNPVQSLKMRNMPGCKKIEFLGALPGCYGGFLCWRVYQHNIRTLHLGLAIGNPSFKPRLPRPLQLWPGPADVYFNVFVFIRSHLNACQELKLLQLNILSPCRCWLRSVECDQEQCHTVPRLF